jgi:hypothetical protein
MSQPLHMVRTVMRAVQCYLECAFAANLAEDQRYTNLVNANLAEVADLDVSKIEAATKELEDYVAATWQT